MNRTKKLVAVAGVALGMGLAYAQPGSKAAPPAMKPPMPPAAPTVDYAAIAEKVVATSANVKEGEIVEIVGGPGDQALLEELAVAVRKRGAFPFINFSSESLARKMVATVPDKYDSQPPKLGLAMAKMVNVIIAIPAVRDGSIGAELAPERRAKLAKTEQQVEQAFRARKVRFIELSNGLAPSAARAKELGISEPELAKIFWDGINADYSAVEAKCKALRDTLAKGTELRITHANGTDLKLKIKGRKVLTSDGTTSDADLKGPQVQVWLPAGDVYTTPVAGSAEGKLFDERYVYRGKEISGIAIDIAKGKVTNITAKSGWDAIKAHYDLAGPGKTEVGFVDFGCNPAIKASTKPETWMGAGMVTIGIGGNQWAGGTNKEPWSAAYQLAGANVTLDGKALIENGLLK